MAKKKTQQPNGDKTLTAEQVKMLAKRKEVRLGAEAAPTVYSNNVSISVSPWDIRLQFGQIEEATTEQLVTRALFTVYMSPQHARVFSDLFALKVAQYETVAKQTASVAKQLQKASDEEEKGE